MMRQLQTSWVAPGVSGCCYVCDAETKVQSSARLYRCPDSPPRTNLYFPSRDAIVASGCTSDEAADLRIVVGCSSKSISLPRPRPEVGLFEPAVLVRQSDCPDFETPGFRNCEPSAVASRHRKVRWWAHQEKLNASNSRPLDPCEADLKVDSTAARKRGACPRTDVRMVVDCRPRPSGHTRCRGEIAEKARNPEADAAFICE